MNTSSVLKKKLFDAAAFFAIAIILALAGTSVSLNFPAVATAATTIGIEKSKSSQSVPKETRILLGFKERYGPENRQHLGIDVYAERDANFHAPVSGEISFVGRVPGSAGLNVTALTITTEAGHQVSINPFSSTKVKKGDSISKGQLLGTISDVGDPSSAESHFHLSLREGGVYKDPTHLLFSGIFGASAVDKNTPSAQRPVVAAPNSPPANSTSSSPVAQAQTQTKAQSSGAKSTQPQASTQASTQSKTSTQGAEQSAASQTFASAGGEHSSDERVSSSSLATEADKEAISALHLQRVAAADPDFIRAVENSAQADAGQRSILKIGSSGIGLQRELVAYIESLSQIQLAAGMFVTLLVLSSVGLGAWKAAQLMGFDAAVTNFVKKLDDVRAAKRSEESEAT